MPAEPPKAAVAAPAEPAKTRAAESRSGPDRSRSSARHGTRRADLKRDRATTAAEREDRDALTKVYAARNGEPIWVDERGLTARALAMMNDINAADAYGLNPAAFKLPTLAPGGGCRRDDLADAEATLTLAAALKYARHARGGRLDRQRRCRRISIVLRRSMPPTVFSRNSRLRRRPGDSISANSIRAIPQFERLRLQVSRGEVRSARHRAARCRAACAGDRQGKSAKKQGTVPAPQPMSREKLERKLLANMEMWRWMPDDLGDYYIHNNIPEFLTRMYRDGKLVHMERIVVGKPENQTAIFSDAMELVVFKPFWNVPESIKWKELQPQLSRSPDALSRAGLRAAYNGKPIDPATIDWSTADMRALHIFQPPGSGNALGQVKFLFPNKHDIYMHDTPTKHLFNNASRAYSHGCMRVRDPMRFAELLLGYDKGWDMGRIQQLANAGPENNEIRLSKKVPIHVTYFTATVDEDGTLKTFNDIYNHESKILLGLEGKAHLIQQPREEKYQPAARGQVRFVEKGWGGGGSSSNGFENWMKNVFNF